MHFELEKNTRKNITTDHKVLFEQQSQADDGGINESIITGNIKTRFIATNNNIDKTVDIVEVDFGTDFAEESSFNNTVNNLNGQFYSHHKSMFSIPVDYNDTIPYETTSKIPTIRFESSVNYYDADVDMALFSASEDQIPSIYSTTFSQTSKQTRDNIITGKNYENIFAGSNNVVFGDKARLSSYNKNKKSFPSLVEMHISKREQNIFRDVLKDNNMFDLFIEKTEALTKQAISLVNLRAGLVNNYKYSFLNDIIANLTATTGGMLVFGQGDDQLNRKINFLDKLKVIGDLQSRSLFHSNYKTIINKGLVPNETIFYKIKKFIGTQTSTPIKTFYMPSNGNITTFIDTQVLYIENIHMR